MESIGGGLRWWQKTWDLLDHPTRPPHIQDVHNISGPLVPYNHAHPKRGLIHRDRHHHGARIWIVELYKLFKSPQGYNYVLFSDLSSTAHSRDFWSFYKISTKFVVHLLHAIKCSLPNLLEFGRHLLCISTRELVLRTLFAGQSQFFDTNTTISVNFRHKMLKMQKITKKNMT